MLKSSVTTNTHLQRAVSLHLFPRCKRDLVYCIWEELKDQQRLTVKLGQHWELPVTRQTGEPMKFPHYCLASFFTHTSHSTKMQVQYFIIFSRFSLAVIYLQSYVFIYIWHMSEYEQYFLSKVLSKVTQAIIYVFSVGLQVDSSENQEAFKTRRHSKKHQRRFLPLFSQSLNVNGPLCRLLACFQSCFSVIIQFCQI